MHYLGIDLGGTKVSAALIARQKLADQALCIVCCVAGRVNGYTGLVWAPNIPGWETYPLLDQLKQAFRRATIELISDRGSGIAAQDRMVGMSEGTGTRELFEAYGQGNLSAREAVYSVLPSYSFPSSALAHDAALHGAGK